MLSSFYKVTFGSIDEAFSCLLIKADLGSVIIDRKRTTVRVEEELTLRQVVVGAASVMLDRRETYLTGKLVIRAVGQSVFYAPFADFLTFDLESALQGLDALLVD